jgi:dTDP-4-amino-4,6-dideoxygalactose transaminase
MAESAAELRLLDLAAQRRRMAGRIDEAIGKVLQHGRFVLGPEVGELEERLARFCGVSHAVTCASGTDALLLALLAMGVGPGDAVAVPSFTFVASAEVVALVGATPVLVDVEEDTFTVDPASLSAAHQAAQAGGHRLVGLIAVDLFGQPADYPSLDQAAPALGLWVLADAAQSFGASLGGRRVGSLATLTATSFFPAKPLGCYGDGGALFTDDAALADDMRSLRSHGRGRDKDDAVRIGLNSRLDTLQAAVLLEKLSIFEDELVARQRLAERYREGLGDVVRHQVVRPAARSSWAQYTVVVDDRERLVDCLRAAGIPTAVYYRRPLHRQEAFAHCPVAGGGLPVSDRLARHALSLPLHPYLDDASQDRVIGAIRSHYTAG